MGAELSERKLRGLYFPREEKEETGPYKDQAIVEIRDTAAQTAVLNSHTPSCSLLGTAAAAEPSPAPSVGTPGCSSQPQQRGRVTVPAQHLLQPMEALLCTSWGAPLRTLAEW